MNLIVPEGFLHLTHLVFTVVMLPSSEVLAVAHVYTHVIVSFIYSVAFFDVCYPITCTSSRGKEQENQPSHKLHWPLGHSNSRRTRHSCDSTRHSLAPVIGSSAFKFPNVGVPSQMLLCLQSTLLISTFQTQTKSIASVPDGLVSFFFLPSYQDLLVWFDPQNKHTPNPFPRHTLARPRRRSFS